MFLAMAHLETDILGLSLKKDSTSDENVSAVICFNQAELWDVRR